MKQLLTQRCAGSPHEGLKADFGHDGKDRHLLPQNLLLRTQDAANPHQSSCQSFLTMNSMYKHLVSF